MNQKMIGAIIGIAVVVGGGSFYGGMQYGKSKTSAAAGRSSNLSPEERQARFGQMGAQGQRDGMNGFAQGGGAGGEIIAKEEGVEFYYEDFRPGFRKAHNQARGKGLYMQKYCGCIYSQIERNAKK